MSFSGFVGGHKTENARARRARHPELLVERAIRGMIPHNKLGRAVYRKLKVYRGDLHPHAAQQPRMFRSRLRKFPMAQTQEFIATGRRKTSVARIRMTPGSGKIDINGRSSEDYFPTSRSRTRCSSRSNSRRLTPTISPSTPPAEALPARPARPGSLSRGPSSGGRKSLRRNPQSGRLLRRDPRMKERKKSGQPGARKRFQFSKPKRLE